MKKILLLLLLLLTPLIFIMMNSSEDSLLYKIEGDGYSKETKNIKWEYIKDKLFEGKVYRSHEKAKKISGPIILFTLNNATKQDSLAVKTVIEDLKKVIPNKTTDYFSKFTNIGFSEFVNNKSNGDIKGYSYRDIIASTITINFEVNKYQNKRGANKSTKSLYFSFKNETPLYSRKKYIQYDILRTICFIDDKNNETIFLNLNYPTEAIFNDPTYNVLDKEFTELDKYLVLKLYSDDFEEQFSDYMYQTYPWRYANLFVNKNLAYIKVYTLIVVIGLLLFFTSFSLFNSRKTTYWNYFFPMCVVFIGLMNSHWLYRYFIEIELPTGSLNHIIVVLVYVLVSLVVVSFLLWFLEQKLINNYLGFTYQFIMKLVLTFSALHIPIILGYFLLDNTNENLTAYGSVFFVFLTLTLGRGLLIYLNHFSDSLINQKEVELSRLKELNAKNELKSLHAHINPHFLYNALNSIASLMHESTSKAEEMIISLSDLFRYSINRKEKNMSTVKDEVTMVKNYLKIEKIRFGKRLNFIIDVDEGLLEKEIPMYILQPLVENAVKHGVSKVEHIGEIKLEIKQNKNNLLIFISDNGKDFPEDLYSGFGLQSVNDLLRLSYGDKASLNWTNTPKKKIIISTPLQ
ncbi:histidine kinase [Flavobacteriaceae bacterium GSB9]|nr:histidine kinase [Flavobacteriaceae bacterium GSB9]